MSGKKIKEKDKQNGECFSELDLYNEEHDYNLEEIIKNIKMIMFGGKGGVGKTTCAGTTALTCALMGFKTLIISTDPAHSLSDSFYGDKNNPTLTIDAEIEKEQKIDKLMGEIIPEDEKVKVDKDDYETIGPEIKQIYPGLPLYGIELDAKYEFTKKQRGLEEAQKLLATASEAPGMDEFQAFFKLMEILDEEEEKEEMISLGETLKKGEEKWDKIIFDTAPTGHTVNLLGLPEFYESFYGKAMKFRLRMLHIGGKIKNFFKRNKKDEVIYDEETGEPILDVEKTIDETIKSDSALEQLRMVIETVGKGREVLTDPSKTNFVVVTIPETMGVAETDRLIANLYRYEIPNSTIIVNHMEPGVPIKIYENLEKAIIDPDIEELIKKKGYDIKQEDMAEFRAYIKTKNARRKMHEGHFSEIKDDVFDDYHVKQIPQSLEVKGRKGNFKDHMGLEEFGCLLFKDLYENPSNKELHKIYKRMKEEEAKIRKK